MSIKVLKLVTTEDVIGDYSFNDGKHVLSNPARIVMFPSEDGSGVGLALMPWLPFSGDKEVVIKENALVSEPVGAVEAVLNEYRSKFGSGIVTPKKGLII